MKQVKFKNVEEYFDSLPPKAKKILKELRSTIKKSAPGASEVISYNMPAIKIKSVLVFYAAFESHIGFYPTPSGIEAFQEELSTYKGAKGSVQFPIDKPLPLELIARIVKFRVSEDQRPKA